jgi:hypothetical protein
MVKRQARESIEKQKAQMIAALYANSAFDESKEGQKARAERIKSIEKHFNRAIELIYDPHSSDPDENEIDWNNPFWMAARRAKQRRDEIVAAQKGTANVQDVIEMDKDQLKARAESRSSIDQL